METRTDSELGRLLLTERGMQWLYAQGGDPYARLLRGEEDDWRGLDDPIRERGPLHRSRTGAWVAGSHGLGVEIFRDARLVPRMARGGGVCGAVDLGAVQLGSAGSEAVGLGVAGAGDVEVWGGEVERLCGRVIDGVGGVFDLVRDVVRPVLVAVAGEVLGVPGGRRARFAEWCGAVGAASDAVLCPPVLPRALALGDALGGLRALVRELEDADDDASVAAGMLVCVVGVEVAVNLAANAVLAVLTDLERSGSRWPEFGREPGAAESLVEETLWRDPPVRLDSRIAREDLELAGREIAAGDEVVVHVGAAHRDLPAGRCPLPLADGTYAGDVAPMVRASAAAVLRALPGLRPAGPVVRRLRAPVTRSIVRFPVAVTAAPAKGLAPCAF
ncbi:hypothetical protein AB0D49_24415 [Streptomyces sp. NPDC048290]|uniref:cytochrome P450 family protein n=1 Tax=Streptomyces sp. NPDC048290 TaxID=3155811 RepID=UPI003445BD35